MEMSRIGINQMTTRNWTLEEDIEHYAKLGIRNIGLFNFKYEGRTAEEVRDLLKAKQMHVSQVCFGGMYTGETEEERQHALEDTRKAIDFSKIVEADSLLIVAGPIRSHSHKQAIDLVREGLKDTVSYAEKKGVMLGLEPIHPMETSHWSVVNTIKQSLELIDDIQSPNLGIYLDTYHIWWDTDVLSNIRACKGKIAGVHLADWRNPCRSFNDRTIPGRGVIHFHEMVQEFEKAVIQVYMIWSFSLKNYGRATMKVLFGNISIFVILCCK
ncbi:MAG: sugar phosphate isomerase/epimerase family protein [Bacilli bacterium]